MTLNDDCVLVKIVTCMQTLKHLVLLNPYNSVFMCNWRLLQHAQTVSIAAAIWMQAPHISYSHANCIDNVALSFKFIKTPPA